MKSKFIPYNPKLKQTARKLRKQGILSEVLLWNELKGKKVLGYDFHRQKPLKNYIVDFYCNELMLAIEIDGSSHNYQLLRGQNRQIELEKEGIRFLRYSDAAILKNVKEVVEDIKRWVLEKELKHTPSPLARSHPSQEGNIQK